MTDPTDHLRSRSENLEEAREDRAEAAEHYGDAESHRRRAAADRSEADRDRAEGDPLEAFGNEVKAKGHDLAAGGHDRAGRHDEREAADEAHAGGGHSLLGEEHHRRFRSRWDDVQASFVDEPRKAVAAADDLVREATEAIHSLFERDRRQLEGVWDRGDDVSTEDLRVTLQRYRSFFERLLSL